ncbi:Olfactory receptor [Dirofilaria immitis]
MASIAILFLAIDRFLAVRSPLKYRTIRSTHFIGLALSIGFTYSTMLVITGLIVADDEIINPCDQTMAYSPDLMTVWNYCSVGIDSAVVILNIINYYLLRNIGKRHQLSESDYAAYRRQNQLTNSMLIIMGDISSFLCLLILFNYGNNYYILLWRSHVYRAKFLEQLHLIRGSATVGFTNRIATITKKCKWFQ